MKTAIMFSLCLILVGFAQLEDTRRHIDSIEQRAQTYFDRDDVTRYVKIVKHSENESKDGGVVCYRAIHVVDGYDLVCLGYDGARDEVYKTNVGG